MSNEVINYSSKQFFFNQRLQNNGQTLSLTTNNINNFTIDNPYFQSVGSIIDKFGPFTSQNYNIGVAYKIYGTIGFNPFCWSNMKLYLDNNEVITARDVQKSSDGFEENAFSILNTSQGSFLPYPRTFNFRLEFVSYASGVSTTCNIPSYINLNIEFEYYGQIFIGKFCTENFNDPICLNFCNDPSNKVSCANQSLSWCFNNPTQPEFSRFFQTPNCKTFIKNYISENVSHSQYDKKFNEICKKLDVDASNYKNFTNGIDPSFDLDIKNICACNLDDSIYNNFYDSFAIEIPSIRAANFGSKKCIFPECNTSEYKPTEILGYNFCPRIDCINISQIDNNGRIISGLTINQINNCPNIEDPRKPCVQDGDCSVGKKCLQGICVEENVCRINSNCSADTKCFNNICVRDDYCSKDSDCVDRLKCSKNICVKDISSTTNLTIIIFISIISILVIFFGIILLIYFIKRMKRSE